MILRFDAPLMSFGGPAVDQHGVVLPFPARSMLTGMIANALGYDHREVAKLRDIQQRIRYAVRCDRPGDPIVDFQTVDLGQDELIDRKAAWTTWGSIERRTNEKPEGTIIRYRRYRADCVFTLSITLYPPDEQPTLNEVAEALRSPQRPLFIGRKCCLPATPIMCGFVEAADPLAALLQTLRLPTARSGVPPDAPLQAWWDEMGGTTGGMEQATSIGPQATRSRAVLVSDMRDWANQVHCGRTRLVHGLITPGEA